MAPLFIKLLMILLATVFIIGCKPNSTEPSRAELIPIARIEYQRVEAQDGKPFRVCGLCTCCNASSVLQEPNNICYTMKCCFGIKCSLPGKPFGFCAFQPIACNCSSCSP